MMDDNLPSSLMEEDEANLSEEEMLQLLMEDQIPLACKQDWQEEQGVFIPPGCKIEGLLYDGCTAVPPIYPTFECDPHNPADPRSVSSFLGSSSSSSESDSSPPSSPGEVSSPEI